MYAYLSSVCQF